MTPSKEENPNGLYRKYNITRTDGKPIPEDAEFFILRLDRGAKDKKNLAASKKAMEAYINELRLKNHLPDLKDDIYHKWVKGMPLNDKKRVFALYHGVRCMRGNDPDVLYPADPDQATNERAHLLLKPLKGIDDEDFDTLQTLVHNGTGLNRLYIPIGLLRVDAIDFLRSRGYALPAFGYSIEDLVYFGVVELEP